MKNLLFPLLAIATIVMAACSLKTSTSTDPQLEAAVKAKLESREYSIFFDHATPNSAALNNLPQASRIVNLTTNYNIRLSGDFIYSYLPYFGESYMAVIGRQDGLVFDGPITGYKSTSRSKGAIEIKFTARTFEDRYDYTIMVYPNGRAYLTVNPDRKTSISFDGMLRLDK